MRGRRLIGVIVGLLALIVLIIAWLSGGDDAPSDAVDQSAVITTPRRIRSEGTKEVVAAQPAVTAAAPDQTKFLGDVVDERGAPIAGARLRFAHGQRSSVLNTGPDGH